MKVVKTLLSTLFFVPQVAFAVDFEKIKPLRAGTELGDILTKIIDWILWLAGALVVIYLIYGGIVYITAAGNEDKVKAGKSILLHSIIGIVIILVSLLIVRWIKLILETGRTGL